MFKLNDEVVTRGGYSARIICVDAPYKVHSTERPIVALVKVPTSIVASGVTAIFYDKAGLSSNGNNNYCLLSNEPTEDEAKLIASLRDIIETGARDDNALVKVLRQIRAK